MEKQTLCRACKAPIIFIKTTAGKTMPCDAEAIPFYAGADGAHGIETFVTPDGQIKRGYRYGSISELGKTENQLVGYISHFATCTNPDFFRKPRKSDRKRG